MDRRQFLRRAGGLGLAAALAPATGHAGVSCVAVHSALSRCSAGMRQTPPIGAQPCRALAWATCLAYILDGYGARLDEAAVLARYGMEPGCSAIEGDPTARLLAAAGTWRDGFGRRFLVRTRRLPDLAAGHLPLDDARVIIERLSRQPVLCGAAGHTTLLTELSYTDGAITRLKVTGATVRDPWTESHGLRTLRPDELARPFPLVALSIRAL